MGSLPSLLDEDEALLVGSQGEWDSLAGARILLTGGTGFVGRWLVSAFVCANRAHHLGASLVLLTRDAAAFARACPDLACGDGVVLIGGDVRSTIAGCLRCTHIIHAATPSDGQMNSGRAGEMLSIIEDGTKNMLAVAEQQRVRRFLLVSSGAVYESPAPSDGYREDSEFGPDWPREPSAYHAGKRRAEALAANASASGLPLTVARLFAFVGPHLPLDRHFAIGNFLADALSGRPVGVTGDGSAVRSYLYAAEMAAWMWRMLADDRAAGCAYNLGSENAVSIREAAWAVARAVEPAVPVHISGRSSRAVRDVYLPCMRRAREGLGLRQSLDLAEAIRRTVAWNRSRAQGEPQS